MAEAAERKEGPPSERRERSALGLRRLIVERKDKRTAALDLGVLASENRRRRRCRRKLQHSRPARALSASMSEGGNSNGDEECPRQRLAKRARGAAAFRQSLGQRCRHTNSQRKRRAAARLAEEVRRGVNCQRGKSPCPSPQTRKSVLAPSSQQTHNSARRTAQRHDAYSPPDLTASRPSTCCLQTRQSFKSWKYSSFTLWDHNWQTLRGEGGMGPPRTSLPSVSSLTEAICAHFTRASLSPYFSSVC